MRRKKSLHQAHIKTRLKILLNKPQNNLKKMLSCKQPKLLMHKSKKDMFLRVKKLLKTLLNQQGKLELSSKNEEFDLR